MSASEKVLEDEMCYGMNFRLRCLVAVLCVGGVAHWVLSTCSDNYIFSFAREYEYEDPLQVSETELESGVFGATMRTSNTSSVEPSVSILNSAMSEPDNSTSSPFLMSPQPPALQQCPVHPPSLVGPIRVYMDEPKMEQLEKIYSDVQAGGHNSPKDCMARHRVAIIVPYRDRMAHLRVFLHNFHSFLRKQQLDYAIFLVEPIASQTFNRAKLMNIGYAEALKMYDWQCFIFHDVDLMPEDDRNIYSCPQQPRHMSVAIDKFNYALPYRSIFGGISALSREHMKKTNGFSNDYWGWGGEDDDMSSRVVYADLKISRYPKAIARYKMIKHTQEKRSNPVNKCRHKLMKYTKKRYKVDGLSNLNYKVTNITQYPLYTHIMVDVLEKESRQWLATQGFPNC